MNEKFLQLYNYLNSNGMVEGMSAQDFYNSYSSGDNFNQLYGYLNSEGMTDLSSNDFQSTYFADQQVEDQQVEDQQVEDPRQAKWRQVTEEEVVPVDQLYSQSDEFDPTFKAEDLDPVQLKKAQENLERLSKEKIIPTSEKIWAQFDETSLDIVRHGDKIYQLDSDNNRWNEVVVTEDWAKDPRRYYLDEQTGDFTIRDLTGSLITPVEDDEVISNLNTKFNTNIPLATRDMLPTIPGITPFTDFMGIKMPRVKKPTAEVELYSGYDEDTKGMKFRKNETNNVWESVDEKGVGTPVSLEVSKELNKRHGTNLGSVPEEPVEFGGEEDLRLLLNFDKNIDPKSVEEYKKVLKEANGKPVVFDFSQNKYVVKEKPENKLESYSVFDSIRPEGFNYLKEILNPVSNAFERKKSNIKQWEGTVKNFIYNNNIASLEEEEAIRLLRPQFERYGFIFEETDAGDGMIVSTSDGLRTQYINLDTDDYSQNIALQDFLIETAGPQAYGIDKTVLDETGAPLSYESLINKVEKQISTFKKLINGSSTKRPIRDEKGVIVGYEDTREPVAKAYGEYLNSEEYKTYLQAKKTAKQYERAKMRNLYDEVKADPSEGSAARKKVMAFLDDKYLSEFRTDYNVELNDLSLFEKHLISQYEDYSQQVKEFDLAKGSMTPEEASVRNEELNKFKKHLDTNKDKFLARKRTISEDIKRLEYLTGKYVVDKSKMGNIGSGLLNSFMDGVSSVYSTLQPWVRDNAMSEGRVKASSLTKEEEKRYRAQGLKSEDEIANAIGQEIYKEFKEKNANDLKISLGDMGVSKEYMQSEDRGFVTKALFGVAQSLPAMLTSAMGTPASLTALSAQAFSAIEDEMLNDPDFKGESLSDIGLIAVPYAMGMGVLEKIGLSTALSKNPAAKSLILKSISSTIKKIGGSGSKDLMEKVLEKEIKSNIAKFGLRVAGGFLAEAETGATQSLVLDIGYKELINQIKGNDRLASELTGGELFDTPDSVQEGILQVVEDGIAEGIGGIVMTGAATASQGLINGNISLYNTEDVEFLKSTTTDHNIRKSLIAKLKADMLGGRITKSEAQKQLDAVDKVSNIFKSVPENLSEDQQVQAVNLIVEKQRLEKQIEGKDESLVAAQKQRISDIDNELKKLSEDAFQKQTTGEVPVQPEATVGEEVEGRESQAEPQVVTEEENKISVYHGGEVSDINVASKENPLFVSEDESQANEYAKGNEGSVAAFDIDNTKVASEQEIYDVINKLGLESKEEGWDINDLSVFELLDNRFETSLSDEGISSVFSELEKMGYGAARFTDTNLKTNKQDIQNIVVFNPNIATETQAQTEPSTKNQITVENVDEMRAKQKTSTGQKVVTAAKMVLNSLPGVKIYVHETTSDYEGGIKQKSDEGDRGAFIPGTNEIHINLENGGDLVTLFHEAMHSALQSKGMETGAILDMAKGLQAIISDKNLKQRLAEFISQYDENDKAEEYLAELGGIMSEARKELTTTKLQRFKALLGRIFKKLGLPDRMVPFANTMKGVDAAAFINNITKQLRTGEQVVSEGEIYTPGSQILGTPEIKKSKQAKIENFDTTPPKVEGIEMIYPEKSTIDNVLESSGGSAIFINSDGTKVGKVLVNGRELNIEGGIDYTFIKKNVDDNVGFAASEDQKISYLQKIANELISERDSKNPQHKGKPIAVFVTSQNGETMLGEWYAAEYIMEGLDQAITKRKYKGGKTQAKKDFISAIESAKLSKTELGMADKKAKDRVLQMIKEGKFDTHNGRLEIAREMASKNFSFGFRVNFNKELLSANEKTWNSGKNRGIKKALADVGHTTNDFWNKFMDERFLKVLNSTRLQADKGSSVSNKTFSGFFYNPSDSLEDQIKHARLGIDHAQFNSSFKSQGNFLLDSAYDVNKLFPNMGYPTQTGIDTYNEANKTDFSKKNTNIIDKINISTWLNENNKSDLVVNPYSSISLSIYTGITKEQQPEKLKKQKGERLAPNGKPSNLNEIQYELVRTPEFKNWFGDWENNPENASKVVDENGEPLVVYHGSAVPDIEVFDRTKSGKKSLGLKEMGTYFSTNPELSSIYAKAERSEDYNKELKAELYRLEKALDNVRSNRDYDDITKRIELLKKGKVYPVFLNIRDMVTFDANFDSGTEAWNNLKVKADYKTAEGRDAMEFLSPKISKEENLSVFGVKPVNGIKAKNIIEATYSYRKGGYNVTPLTITEETKNTQSYKDFKEKYGGDAYLLFDGQPQNIKLADGTNKTFDPQQPSIKFQKGQTPRQQAIQKAKDKYELSVEKRGNSHNQGVSAALGDLEKSDWYENADDTAKEDAVREIEKFFGAKLKKAPSAKKITGAPKRTKVTVDEAAALKDQIRLEAKAAREAKKDLNEKRKGIAAVVKGMVKSGKITEKQAASIVAQSNIVNLDNPEAVQRFLDYVGRVFEDANYREKLLEANKKKKSIRRAVKTNNQAEVIGMAKNFLNVDPSMAEDIDEYLEIAEKVYNAVRPSRVKDASVIYKEAANIGDINEYTQQQLKIQEDNYKKMLIAQYNDLKEAGLISESMDIKELVDTINMLKDPNESTDNTERVRKAVITRLDSMIGVLNNILQNKINPITGEDIDISEKDQKILKAVANMELENLDIRSLIYLTEALENYFVNGITSGLEANVKSYIGVVKANILFSSIKGTKSVYSISAEQILSLPLLIERIFRSQTIASKFMQDSGLMDIINGKNKAETTYNLLLSQYAKQDFYKQKDFMAEDNMYERGMLAFLMRNVSGNQEQMKAETQRRINAIKESIDNLSKSKDSDLKDKAKKYQEVADKLNLDSNDIDVIMANASKMNEDAVNWWINQWQQHYQDLYDISLSVYNTKLSSDVNYTPDNIKKTDTVSSEIDSESSFISSLGYVDTRKTGVLMENQRALPKDGYVDLSFEMNNAKSLRSALVDINTAGAIRQTKAFLETKAYKDAMPDTKTRNILNKRISNYISRSKGKQVDQKDSFKKLEKTFNALAKFGTVKALGGIFSAPKQLTPLVNTLWNSGRIDIVTPSQWKWISELGMGISNRGAEADAAVTMVDRRISKLAEGIGKVADPFSKVGDFWINVAIKYPDAIAARSSFISYYKRYLERNGINVNDIDWSTHEVNQEAADYAQLQVDRQQNISDPLLAGELWLSEKTFNRFITRLLMPFTSFIWNQRARSMNDLLTLTSNLSSKEEKTKAFKSISALPIELAVFQAIGMAGRYAIEKITDLIFGEEDDDEEKIEFDTIFGKIDEETFRLFSTPIRSFAVDLLSPLPGLTDDMTIWAINKYGFEKFPMLSDESIDELVDEENKIRLASGKNKLEGKELDDFIEKIKEERTFTLFESRNKNGLLENLSIGSPGILFKTVSELDDMYTAWKTGEIITESFGKEKTKYLNEEDRSDLGYAILLKAIYGSGILPREAGTIADKAFRRMKKNAVSESFHEKQGELKKTIGRDPNELELLLLEKGTKPQNIKKESNYINKMLDEDQVKEYIKVRSKVQNVSDKVKGYIARNIAAGLTAEQVIDKLAEIRGKK